MNHDVFYKGEQVVQSPVQDKSRGRIVEKHQEHQRYENEFDLIQDQSLIRVNKARGDVDHGHEYGEKINGQGSCGDESVGCAEVFYRTE